VTSQLTKVFDFHTKFSVTSTPGDCNKKHGLLYAFLVLLDLRTPPPQTLSVGNPPPRSKNKYDLRAVMINQQKICARDLQDKVDACQGDSGGPLMALELGSPGSLQGQSPENVLTYHPFYPFYTDRKEKKIFLIYKEIQKGAVAKSYLTNGLLIYC
jgi:hypothetical protein